MVILSNCIRNFFRKFELIGNSVQGENPAPDNPQEIKSAGRKSKNLFNISDLKNGQVQSDGTIKAVGVYKSIVLNIKEDGKYFITFKKNDEYDVLYFTTLYSSEIFSNPYINIYPDAKGTILLKKGRNILSFKAKKNGAECPFINDYEIMIAAESETTDYEPYGYFLNVKATGKNLFDQSKLISGFINMTTGAFEESANTSFANSLILDKPILLKSGQTLVTSVDNKYPQNFLRYRTYRKDGTFLINNEPISFSYKATEDLYVIALFYNGMSEEDKKSLQIEISDKPTPYEPYTEQSVQIALDEPLRGVGEYKDTITKDGVVRKIKRTVFDGSEDEKWVLSNDPKNVTTNRFMIGMDTINTYYKIFTMCDKLSWVKANNVDLVGQTTHGKAFYVTMPKELAPNLEAFKTWLSQNPLIVDYVLAEPVTEPLPESVQQQLQALHSENGTTHVFVDSGEVEAGINIEYKYKS